MKYANGVNGPWRRSGVFIIIFEQVNFSWEKYEDLQETARTISEVLLTGLLKMLDLDFDEKKITN